MYVVAEVNGLRNILPVVVAVKNSLKEGFGIGSYIL